MNPDRDAIIRIVKRAAEMNGGEPLGERTFYAQTKVTRSKLQRAGFPNYGAAVEAAGFQRGRLTQAFSDDQLFEPLAELTRRLGHYPTTNERQVARYSNSSFPSYEAYSRRAETGPLREALLAWCRQKSSFEDVVQILSTEAAHRRATGSQRSLRKRVRGYVYLMRYGNRGKEYKIGFTENVSRRQSQIDMMSPKDVKTVHVIETDDPQGIEKYWLARFAQRRVATKEVFRLTAEDVAAFKSRRYQ